MEYLAVRNWRRFQHYKQRNPPWIKLHASLLDDPEFWKLTDRDKSAVVLIRLLAARCENKIPNDAEWIRSRIGLKRVPNLTGIVEAGFLVEWQPENQATENNGDASESASTTLARRKQDAMPETETEAEAYKKEAEQRQSEKNPARSRLRQRTVGDDSFPYRLG